MTLSLVFDSLIMSRLMYASPSWSAYLNVECGSTMQTFLLFTKSVNGLSLAKFIRLAAVIYLLFQMKNYTSTYLLTFFILVPSHQQLADRLRSSVNFKGEQHIFARKICMKN